MGQRKGRVKSRLVCRHGEICVVVAGLGVFRVWGAMFGTATGDSELSILWDDGRRRVTSTTEVIDTLAFQKE